MHIYYIKPYAVIFFFAFNTTFSLLQTGVFVQPSITPQSKNTVIPDCYCPLVKVIQINVKIRDDN